MALSKITLKLGKKTIELTQEQFEELKQDMRNLDKQHHYYWHNSPWYQPYYTNGLSTTTTTAIAGGLVYAGKTRLVEEATLSDATMKSTDAMKPGAFAASIETAQPPAFRGAMLSTT